MKSICVAIPKSIDIPIDEYLSLLNLPVLSGMGRVDVLYFKQEPYDSEMKQHLEKYGANFVDLSDIYKTINVQPRYEAVEDTYIAYQYLKDKHYDYICFDTLDGMGFHTIQAKKTTRLFDSTSIIVTMYSNTEWLSECNRSWSTRPIEDAYKRFMERYCCKNADLLVSPTNYMVKWARSRQWELPENIQFLGYNTQLIQKDSEAENAPNYRHLIFYEQLTIAGGVELFLDGALELLKQKKIDKVSFVGKNDWMYGETSENYIKQFLKGYDVEFFLHLPKDEQIAYLQKAQGLVVIPSMSKNYPVQVVDCIRNRIAFIASEVGAIREYCSPKTLFSPNKKQLLDCIISFNADECFQDDQTQKNDIVSAFTKGYNLGQNALIEEKIKRENPLVSICIAHYNHHEFLPMTLESVAGITYPNFEVVVVDDGSTQEESLRVFGELEKKYSAANWRFFRKENEYLGRTRNFSVDKANGDFIVFVDADNLALPEMVEDFVFGMYKAETDCLTCHIQTFMGRGLPKAVDGEVVMLPIGQALELGMFSNVFGDANFIIRKSAYINAGGFPEERLSLDDWGFLANFALKGFGQDVIPLNLYRYRVLENSMVRTGDNYGSQMRILGFYEQHLPRYMQPMIHGVILPLYYKSEILYKSMDKEDYAYNQGQFDQYMKFAALMGRLFPANSWRRRVLKCLKRLIK